MKKYIPYIIITILLVIIASGVTYIVMDKQNDKTEIKDNEPSNKEITDNVKLKDVYNLNDKIIEELEITLNEKIKIMKIEYSYDYYLNDDFEQHYIFGTFNDTELYYNLIRENKNNSYKNDIFNVETIKQDFDEENFKIIKGTDGKSYLIIIVPYQNDYESDSSGDAIAYVYNENLELISKDSIIDDYNSVIGSKEIETHDYFSLNNHYYNIVEKAEGIKWYQGKYCINKDTQTCNSIFKIENNKIYYLALVFNDNYQEYEENEVINNYGKIEERVYTINNNKLNYEVINSYKITEMSNVI